MQHSNEIKLEKRGAVTIMEIEGDITAFSEPFLNDAYQKVLEHQPEVVFLDIEMPRMDGYEFAADGTLSVEEALCGGGSPVLVHSVLGMHTQDPVRGEYSVLAPQAVVYRDGRPRGRIAST